MIALLGEILAAVSAAGAYVLAALETCVNAVLAAMVALYAVIISLLPGMSDAPAIGHPQWLSWLSWFYPVGDLLAGLAIIITLWVTWLGFRYALRLVRGI